MPGIYEVRCDHCDYKADGSSYLAVTMPDGTEEICPHPMEIEHAEIVTKEKWSTLMKQGRIRYRHAMFCRECGVVDYYGSDHPRQMTHLGNPVHTPTRDEATGYRCLSCGKDALFPMIWGRGCLLSLVEKVGLLKKIEVACPKCKTGKLNSGVTAIS
jgi:hypothetical protein